MKKFYIVYKDTSHVEGTVNCTEEEFINNFIIPNKDNVHSYYLSKQEITEKELEIII